ncbi:MAG TPA: hypothetical protein VML96_06310 [Egibacteraceae bacterium]|nr:hypothetical protein [Egibacteraceae bacterium]
MSPARARVLAAVRLDLRLQVRYGIAQAASVVTLLWIVVLRALPDPARQVAVPLVIFGDLAIIGFFFIGGMVLFERGEGTLSALAISPLSPGEYLAARLFSLTSLALASSLVVLAATAWDLRPGLAATGASVAVLSIISLLVGFVTVAPFDAVSRYMIPSVAPLLLLGAPLLARLDLIGGPLLFLLPSHGAMVFLSAAFDADAQPGVLALGAASSAIWVAILWRAAGWAHRRWVVPVAGAG